MNNSEDTLAISGLHDVEEDIWSSKWGLKGKVDASVQSKVAANGDEEESVSPLEIKTGRSVGVMAHRAQTMLYTLLMEERYGRSNGLVLVTNSCSKQSSGWLVILYPAQHHPSGTGQQERDPLARGSAE